MAGKDAYTKAEEMIEEVRRSGATSLDLSGLGLTRLPESLSQLTHLQSLNISHNRLTALPEWLGRLVRLQTLDVKANELT